MKRLFVDFMKASSSSYVDILLFRLQQGPGRPLGCADIILFSVGQENSSPCEGLMEARIRDWARTCSAGIVCSLFVHLDVMSAK